VRSGIILLDADAVEIGFGELPAGRARAILGSHGQPFLEFTRLSALRDFLEETTQYELRRHIAFHAHFPHDGHLFCADFACHCNLLRLEKVHCSYLFLQLTRLEIEKYSGQMEL